MQRKELKPLQDQILQYKRKYYINTLLKGVITAISIILAGFTALTLLEHLAQMSSNARKIFFFAFIFALITCVYYWIGVPIYKLLNLNKFLDDEEASKKIGLHFPDIKDKLLNTLQLQKTSGDNSLAMASINIRENTLSKYEFHKAIDLTENRKHARFVFLILGVLGIMIFYRPEIVFESSKRILNYDQHYLPFKFVLLNENLNVPKNGNLTVQLEIEGDKIPNEVFISDGQIERRMLQNNNEFTFTFERIQQEKTIEFMASGYNSEKYTISIVNQPNLLRSKVKVNYPKYLNIIDNIIENSNHISVPEGSQLSWNIATEATDNASLLSPDNKIKEALKIDDRTINYSKQFLDNESLVIELENNNGIKKTINYQINVIKDQYPTLDFEQYKDTLFFNYLVVGGTATDDYGLTRMQINYEIVENSSTIKKGSFRLPVRQNSSTQNFTHQFLLDSLLKRPGQQINYYITVWDNDGINGSKYTRSKVHSFQIPSKKDLRSELNEESKKTESQMDMSMEKINDVKKKTEDIDKSLKSKKNMDWNDKQNVEELIKEHKKLEQELENLSKQFQKQIEKEKRFENPDPDEIEKMKQLQKMMDELLDEETKKMLQELQELMQQQMDKDELQKMMEDISKKDKLMNKELDRIMELFKELEFEQKMNEAIKDLEELAEKQQELAEKTQDKAADKEELLKEQQKLNEEFKDIQKSMEELEQMNKELENPKNMENTDSQENSIENEQKESEDALNQGKNKKASESQQGAAQKMKEMADKMKESQEGMEQEAVEENIDDLRQILNNLIIVSKDQEAVMEKFRTVNQADPRYVELSQDQLKIREDMQVIEDSLYALSKRVFQLESFITKELADLNDHLDQASEVLKARKPREATKDQQYAMTSMNNLALLLDDVLQQLQQQMMEMQSNKNCSGGNCNKKNGQGGKKKGKKPGSLSDLQKALNQKIQQLKDGQKDGKSISKELAESAAQQEMIRRAMQEMKKELEKGGGKAGGDLDKLEEMMEQTEKDIVNKRITQETIERQKQIETRLLQAEKSMRERDIEEKRESRTAENIDRKLPPEVEKYIQERQKQIELLKTVPPSLHPYYKEKVLQYFEKIENYNQNY